MSVSALWRLKNHNVPHLHPNFTMFMPLNRFQLKICAFSGKFNVCSKWVLLSWIEIYRDFTLQTQIFTQKYRSWLRFYPEFLRKKLAVEVSGVGAIWEFLLRPSGQIFLPISLPPFKDKFSKVFEALSIQRLILFVSLNKFATTNLSYWWEKMIVKTVLPTCLTKPGQLNFLGLPRVTT